MLGIKQDSGEKQSPFLTSGASPPGPSYAHYNPAAPADPLQPSRTPRSQAPLARPGKYAGQGAVRAKGKLGSSPCRGRGGEKAPDGALVTEFVPCIQDPLCSFATPPSQCLSANQE